MKIKATRQVTREIDVTFPLYLKHKKVEIYYYFEHEEKYGVSVSSDSFHTTNNIKIFNSSDCKITTKEKFEKAKTLLVKNIDKLTQSCN